MKGEVVTPNTKHTVTTWALFTNAQGNLWKKSISYINDAIYYYSLWNGDYPYNQCTAVDGTISAGSGMEYPNITVIGASENAFQLDLVIAHEVGHNWFYGMLGSNERRHPWMDEGINSYNELRYVETKYPERNLIGDVAEKKIGKRFDLLRYKQKSKYYLSYLYTATKNTDQPIELPAPDFTEENYGCIIYSKTPIVFNYLKTYIGEKKMDEAMQQYFREWQYKHPQPEDFKKVIEHVSGKNLDWFFDDLINSTKKLDYKIAFAHQNNDKSWDIGIKNTKAIKGPIFIQGIKDKRLVGELNYDGFLGKQALTFPPATIDYFKIDLNEDMPELNRKNNTIRTKGLFKKVEPLKLQFLGSLNNPTKTQLFFTPVVGWNNYNKWMFGAAFYNAILPRKNFEFEIMPLYSYATNDLAGYAHIAKTFHPQGQLFQYVQLAIVGTRYAYENTPFDLNFNKIAPELTIQLKKKKATSRYTNTLKYRNITLIEESFASRFEFNKVNYSRSTTYSNFNDLTYILAKRDPISPYKIAANFQATRLFLKTSLTINYSYHFEQKNKGVDVRFFAGAYTGSSKTFSDYRFRLSGQRGYQDYLYDNIYLGRSESTGLLANQFTETDGGFKCYTAIGQSGKWLTAINIKSSLGNMKLPISLFADIGTAANDGIVNQKLLYDAGICLSIRKDIFEIYFPLLLANDFKNEIKANGLKYQETIRFTLNINLLNPFELVRNFSF